MRKNEVVTFTLLIKVLQNLNEKYRQILFIFFVGRHTALSRASPASGEPRVERAHFGEAPNWAWLSGCPREELYVTMPK